MNKCDISNIIKIKNTLDNNNVVAIPTDTIFGLATNLNSYNKIIELKKRDNKPLVIMCSSFEEMTEIIEIDINLHKTLKNFIPGAITIVGKTLKDKYKINKGFETTGVRVPSHPSLLKVLKVTGPLVVSSANISGEKETYCEDDVYSVFNDMVSLYVGNDQQLSMEASTVININTLEVYRQNSLTSKLISELKKNM